jgi:thiamine biosynthesis lipoprotein
MTPAQGLCNTRGHRVVAGVASMSAGPFRVQRERDCCRGSFPAMASPCEVLVAGEDLALAERVTARVCDEALRIERKFSRYRDDNVVARINGAQGAPVETDEETDRLLGFADTLHDMSGGRFDITSGVLRGAWRFDGSDRVPTRAQVDALLPLMGWQRVERSPGRLRLPAGMELDFGGIGKEYAVDRCLRLADELAGVPVLVNFGGDLACNGGRFPGASAREWQVGVESPDGGVARLLGLRAGAMATSGDARRFLLKDGKRYPHILDARTGWPVMDAPRSVTVFAASCVEAGSLATLAMLHGAGAGAFLEGQGVRFWLAPSAGG